MTKRVTAKSAWQTLEQTTVWPNSFGARAGAEGWFTSSDMDGVTHPLASGKIVQRLNEADDEQRHAFDWLCAHGYVRLGKERGREFIVVIKGPRGRG